MLELIGVLATVASAWIAYTAFQHQKKESIQRNSESKERLTSETRDAQNSEHEASDNGHLKPGYIPEGIVLGNKVVLVPGYQDLLFSHSGRFQSHLENLKAYSWVERGDVIGRYYMNVPNSDVDYVRHFLGSRDLSVEITSPVSGLLLHQTLSMLGEWPKQEDVTDNTPYVAFAVLVADDEPPPKAGRVIYSSAIQFIKDHRRPFFRESRYWTKPAMTEEQFSRLIDMQLNAECLLVDAMPKFKEYLEEARTKYPRIRPHIRHLL